MSDIERRRARAAGSPRDRWVDERFTKQRKDIRWITWAVCIQAVAIVLLAVAFTLQVTP